MRLRVTSECMSTTYILTVYTLFIFKGELCLSGIKGLLRWLLWLGCGVSILVAKLALLSLINREDRLSRVIHAEENSLLFANRDLNGCKIYVTHHPCARCAAKIIQVGIKEVYVDHSCMQGEFNEKWSQEIAIATDLFNQSNTQVFFV